MFLTRANVAVDLAAAQHLRKPLFRVNILYDYGLGVGVGGQVFSRKVR